MDLFTIRLLDTATKAKSTSGLITIVEDHDAEGGIREVICAAISMEHDILVCQLAVPGVP